MVVPVVPLSTLVDTELVEMAGVLILLAAFLPVEMVVLCCLLEAKVPVALRVLVATSN
jgi:hypothetical protein